MYQVFILTVQSVEMETKHGYDFGSLPGEVVRTIAHWIAHNSESLEDSRRNISTLKSINHHWKYEMDHPHMQAHKLLTSEDKARWVDYDIGILNPTHVEKDIPLNIHYSKKPFCMLQFFNERLLSMKNMVRVLPGTYVKPRDHAKKPYTTLNEFVIASNGKTIILIPDTQRNFGDLIYIAKDPLPAIKETRAIWVEELPYSSGVMFNNVQACPFMCLSDNEILVVPFGNRLLLYDTTSGKYGVFEFGDNIIRTCTVNDKTVFIGFIHTIFTFSLENMISPNTIILQDDIISLEHLAVKQIVVPCSITHIRSDGVHLYVIINRRLISKLDLNGECIVKSIDIFRDLKKYSYMFMGFSTPAFIQFLDVDSERICISTDKGVLILTLDFEVICAIELKDAKSICGIAFNSGYLYVAHRSSNNLCNVYRY